MNKCTLGCTESAPSGRLKQSPLEPDEMFYQKHKIAGLS